jgi:hypothetical protein
MVRRRNGHGAHRTTFAENILVGGSVAARIDCPFPGAVWRDNIVWNLDDLGDVPESGIKRVDPGYLSPSIFGIRILTAADVGPAAYRGGSNDKL